MLRGYNVSFWSIALELQNLQHGKKEQRNLPEKQRNLPEKQRE